ncbi:hypothetical protein GCM10011613_30990 [Cellvibrio zantedeschiae]|uniref:Uncharacterized protein n=1 Tax=Cellvibrio zantedeschiae TaxID=1237077 RepID=A0ABQ3B810_9GAMM|nr:hypothetical protein [Cellvibrio zantedeschiae]GGY83883.1 hypothetical protein GCM10011613_30990 [Cellvibrio zantedeschiae]
MEYKIVKRFIISSILLAPVCYAQISGDTGGAAPQLGGASAMPADGRIEDWKKLLEQKELDKTAARPAFYAIFKSAQSDLMANKLPKAKKNIDRLHEMQETTDYEKSRIYLLDYWYAGKTGDKQNETAAMEALIPIGAGNVDSQVFIEAGIRLFKRQYNAKDYGGALDTVNHLRKDPTSVSELNNLAMLTSKLEDLASGTQNVSHDVKTDKSGLWSTTLLRRYFYLTNIAGEVKTIDFKCENKTTSIPYKADSVMAAPEAWGKCSINITATPEATYNLIQLTNKPS